MSAYPTLPTAYDSPQELDDGREIDYATNGKPYLRVFFTSTKTRIPVKHPLITTAQLATFDAHYAANKANSFSYTDPITGVARTMFYSAKKPLRTPRSFGRFDVEIELIEA